MSAFPSYSTGTIAIAANATSVVGTGSNWTGVNAMPGDTLAVAGFGPVEISDVTDATHLVIDAWPYAAVTSGTAYSIKKDSPLRFVGAQSAVQVDQLVSALAVNGFYVFVPPDASVPDPSLGQDSQYAFQATTGKLWQKTSGTWNFVGIFKGFGLPAAWDSATAYVAFDVVTLAGTSYVCILANTNQTPPNATYWTVLASKGDTGATGSTGPVPLKPIAAWVTATAYVTGPPASFVSQGGSSYECLIAHTSGTFATDLAAGKWGLVSQKGTDGTGIGTVTSIATGEGLTGGPITSSGTISISDAYRRNIILNSIRNAKSLGAVQPVVNGVAEGFGGNDGINSGASSGYSLDTTNKRVINGVASGSMISAATGTAIGDATGAGGLAAAFDGNISQGFAASATHTAANGYIGKNYSASGGKRVYSAAAYGTNDAGFDGTGGSTTITVTLYGKATAPANGTDGTILGTTSFGDAISGVPVITSTDQTTAWNYVWLYFTTTQGSSPQINVAEVQFTEAVTTNIIVAENGYDSLDFVPSMLQVSAILEPVDSSTLNTDATMEVTRDNGTTWTAATLVQYHTLGTKVYVESAPISVTGQPSGSKPAFRYKTFNNKRIYLYGAVVGAVA